jgi:hypothetical protein
MYDKRVVRGNTYGATDAGELSQRALATTTGGGGGGAYQTPYAPVQPPSSQAATARYRRTRLQQQQQQQQQQMQQQQQQQQQTAYLPPGDVYVPLDRPIEPDHADAPVDEVGAPVRAADTLFVPRARGTNVATEVGARHARFSQSSLAFASKHSIFIPSLFRRCSHNSLTLRSFDPSLVFFRWVTATYSRSTTASSRRLNSFLDDAWTYQTLTHSLTLILFVLFSSFYLFRLVTATYSPSTTASNQRWNSWLGVAWTSPEERSR